MSGTWAIYQAMAAALPPGSVASLNYGNKLVAFMLGISATALATATLPYFSKYVAAGDWTTVRRTLLQLTAWIGAGSIPIVALLIWFSRDIIDVAFGRADFTVGTVALGGSGGGRVGTGCDNQWES